MKLLLSAVLLIFAAMPALAQQPAYILPPEGTTIINLSATEKITLGQDLLQASLRFEIDDVSAKEVQSKINDAIKKALADAKAVSEVTTTTGQYYVYNYDPNPQPPPTSVLKKDGKKEQRWRGSQTIELESKSADKLLELVGRIQDLGFSMNGLNYVLSPEKSEGVRDELMTKALGKLQDRASLAAKALGKANYELLEVNIDAAMPYPQPMMMKAARMEMADSSAGMAAPSAEPGQSDVTLTVSARVLLKK